MLTLNTQPTEKQELDPSGILDLVEIFPTIQGEGPFAGLPSVFVRTAGCNLSSVCHLCDTNYTENRTKWDVDNISAHIEALMPPKSDLVVITGGEPFRQNLLPLIRRLHDRLYRVQIETNGTLYLKGIDFFPRSNLTIVCSPKTGSLKNELMPCIDVLKYVVTAGKVDPLDGLPLDSLGGGVRVIRPWPSFCGEVYVQACDEQDEEKNKANLQEAANSCLKFGYRLSVQLHKMAGLP